METRKFSSVQNINCIVPIKEVQSEFPYNTIDGLLKRAKEKYPSGENKHAM